VEHGTERPTEQRTKDKRQEADNERRRKGDDIAQRTLEVVDRVRQLLPLLEVDVASKHAAKQLWRAVTGGGSNYEEARAAESCADFVHKVRVATKELRETLFWLRVLQRSDWVEPGTVDGLLDEVDQLVAILVVSARTAKSRDE
jgi:four helix bundle protein